MIAQHKEQLLRQPESQKPSHNSILFSPHGLFYSLNSLVYKRRISALGTKCMIALPSPIASLRARPQMIGTFLAATARPSLFEPYLVPTVFSRTWYRIVESFAGDFVTNLVVDGDLQPCTARRGFWKIAMQAHVLFQDHMAHCGDRFEQTISEKLGNNTRLTILIVKTAIRLWVLNPENFG